jgi:hypothetical protein
MKPVSDGLKVGPPLVSRKCKESILDPPSTTWEPLNDGVVHIFDGNKLPKEALLTLGHLDNEANPKTKYNFQDGVEVRDNPFCLLRFTSDSKRIEQNQKK